MSERPDADRLERLEGQVDALTTAVRGLTDALAALSASDAPHGSLLATHLHGVQEALRALPPAPA